MNSLEPQCEFIVVVEIPPQFRTYVPAALLKTQIQYPSYRFVGDGDAVTVRAAADRNDDELRKSVLHAVYREKIYAETLPMRQALVAAVTAR
jgi:hypothetical protein